MANTLLRTARSGVINTARDFSCVIVTADCELLGAADSYPIHVTGGADMMARAMKEIHPDLKRGDAFLHNSPYHGNSHAADHTILVPVFDDGGIHRFTVLAKAHQADCGNSLPDDLMGRARDVYEEGRADIPCRPHPVGLQGCSGRHQHVHDAHPRSRAVAGRLSCHRRRSPHWRARDRAQWAPSSAGTRWSRTAGNGSTSANGK